MYTIIAKVTHECNLRCKYCYVSIEAEKGYMSISTLKNMIYQIASLNSNEGKSHIIWHGGEPLLMGLEFYKNVILFQKELDHQFTNSIQSNAVLLSEDAINFCEENNIHIGVSLDGDQESHNKNRPLKNGESSFNYVLTKIKELKKRNIGGGAICVLNKNTAPKIEEIYHFAKNNQINFKFNPQLPAGNALENDDLGLTNKELTKFYLKLFDLWFYDNSEPLLSIEPFDGIIKSMDINKGSNQDCNAIIPNSCNFRNNCASSFIAIAPNGNVYPCGRFVGDKNFLYGNINSMTLSNVLNNGIRKKFKDRQKGVSECEHCEYLKICNSGCPDHAYLLYNDIQFKDPYCTTYKALFKHIENTISELLNL